MGTKVSRHDCYRVTKKLKLENKCISTILQMKIASRHNEIKLHE